MHRLTWAFKRFNFESKITYHHEGTVEHLYAKEPVSINVWNDKNYRGEDNKVIFINNCLPYIPSPREQFQKTNIRDSLKNYTKPPVPSLPLLKEYNNQMGGVDRHDRMLGQQSIQLKSKRSSIKLFFHPLDSAVVNAFIHYKTQRGQSFVEPSFTRKTHACLVQGKHHSGTLSKIYNKYAPAVKVSTSSIPLQTIQAVVAHQITSPSQIRGMASGTARCVGRSIVRRTQCSIC